MRETIQSLWELRTRRARATFVYCMGDETRADDRAPSAGPHGSQPAASVRAGVDPNALEVLYSPSPASTQLSLLRDLIIQKKRESQTRGERERERDY